MKLTEQLAKHLLEVHVGGNWTTVSLKQVLSDVSWIEANKPYENLNSIAVLTQHTSYYVNALLEVLNGKALNAKDELSFILPKIETEKEWQNYKEQLWHRANESATLLALLPDEILTKKFTDEKYGTYYRNIAGIIEHMHYHVGQIVIIKKLLNK